MMALSGAPHSWQEAASLSNKYLSLERSACANAIGAAICLQTRHLVAWLGPRIAIKQ
jgi:hypothetical protein